MSDVSVDGEVSVYHAELVLVLLSQTSEHIVDVTADGTDGGTRLGVTEPHLALDLSAKVDKLQIHRAVLEVLNELAVLTSDSDDP